MPSESPATSYLKEVDNCDIYIRIIGKEYGVKGKDGLSPTEREFRQFIKKPAKEALIFIKGRDDVNRNGDVKSFIKTIRNLLGVQMSRAWYLLDRLTAAGKLRRIGKKRWARYVIS